MEKDYSHAVSGSLISSLSATVLNEFRFQFAREDRPAPLRRPDITGQSRPLPDTAFDFGRGYRFGMPFFIPVDYYDTAHPVQRQHLADQGPPRLQGRRRVQRA